VQKEAIHAVHKAAILHTNNPDSRYQQALFANEDTKPGQN